LIGVLAMPRITISYRRDDSLDITGRIFDRLAGHFGREAVFRDIDNIPVGVDFRRHIDRVLDESDIILAIVGPRWIGPDNEQLRLASPADPVRLEIETALRKDKPVIPVLVSRAVMPHPDVLPDSLHDFVYRNAVQVDSGQDFDVHVGRLIRAIERLVPIDERTKDEAVQGAPPIEPAPKAERPVEAARQAQEERQRAEAARQAEEEKRRAEPARQAEAEKQWAETTPRRMSEILHRPDRIRPNPIQRLIRQISEILQKQNTFMVRTLTWLRTLEHKLRSQFIIYIVIAVTLVCLSIGTYVGYLRLFLPNSLDQCNSQNPPISCLFKKG
jgi:TIR domain